MKKKSYKKIPQGTTKTVKGKRYRLGKTSRWESEALEYKKKEKKALIGYMASLIGVTSGISGAYGATTSKGSLLGLSIAGVSVAGGIYSGTRVRKYRSKSLSTISKGIYPNKKESQLTQENIMNIFMTYRNLGRKNKVSIYD